MFIEEANKQNAPQFGRNVTLTTLGPSYLRPSSQHITIHVPNQENTGQGPAQEGTPSQELVDIIMEEAFRWRESGSVPFGPFVRKKIGALVYLRPRLGRKPAENRQRSR